VTANVVTPPANLSACERVIEANLRAFTEVGMALITIRDGKLYRASYPTFDAYCSARWGFSRNRAYDLIASTETTKALSSIAGISLPTNEGQARELRGLEPEVAAEVMNEAQKSGKPTAASIKDARERVAPKPEPIAKVTHKTEEFVNTETGEVVGKPQEWQPVPTAADVLAADPEVQHSAYRMSLYAALNAVTLAQFAPADVVQHATPNEYEVIDITIDGLIRWRDAIKAARPTYLRRVQ
jgi:hypothetical protein